MRMIEVAKGANFGAQRNFADWKERGGETRFALPQNCAEPREASGGHRLVHFFEPIQANAAQWPKDMHQKGIDERSKMDPLRRGCYMVVKRRAVEKVQEDAQGGAKVAPKRKGKRRQKVVSRGSESESGAGEDPAGERRSSRQVKLEDQKSNEKQEQNNAPTCAGDSGRRTSQGWEFGNLCDVFTVGRCFQHFFRGPSWLVGVHLSILWHAATGPCETAGKPSFFNVLGGMLT